MNCGSGSTCFARRIAEPSEVTEVVVMPGHAGFAYGFRVASAGAVESWFIRLPPGGGVGTADVLRQVAVLNAPMVRMCRTVP